MASSRGKSFLQEEDQVLCATWLEISQDPVMGSNQKKDKLWERISALFHERISNICNAQRTPKSLSCRMQLIMKAISKFRGCIRQVERLNPSGASELDIIKRARIIFAEDPEERKGFLFDHVWSILKDAEKWANISVRSPATSKTSKSRSSQGSDSSSPVVDLNDDNEEYTHNDEDMITSRPTGRKKEKMRRRQATESNLDLETLNKSNKEIVDILKKSHGERENDRITMHQIMMLRVENEKKKLDIQRERQESKIMLINLDTITDPSEREYFRIKKQEILNRNTTGGSSSDIPNPEYSYAGSQYGIPDYRSGGYGGNGLPDF
ncbi:glutathione S-transferase T3-like [Asparagus officinalis]|uniref:glutathione S-transferase T3-like n=3 Tax=Asparagus officinalis TaxID=4686 RepID=UPI00098E0F5E|nr:glutathione S-transferase T3-like [Asparagus officinalis]